MALRLLLSLCFFFPLLLSAQCFVSSIQLETQAEVDAFPGTYGGCFNLGNVDIIIDGSGITSLAPLSILTEVGGMEIRNTSLMALAGLGNLNAVNNDLRIVSNNQLLTLTGLEGLAAVSGDLTIDANNNLNSLQALSNIGFAPFSLSIFFNSSLTSLAGLENLPTPTRQIDLQSNDVLTDISALSGMDMTQMTGNPALRIRVNELLADCAIASACDLIDGGGQVDIFNNGLGAPSSDCLNATQVANACNPVSTCSDGIQNGDETGVDCGGSSCAACFECTTPSTINGSILLDSQQDVDDFATNYGNCVIVNGNFTIQQGANMTPITNLLGLTGLRGISGDLIIRDNPDLTSVEGLENIGNPGGQLVLVNLPVLTDLSAFSPITSIGGQLLALSLGITDLSGLTNLTTINGSMSISNNPQLTSLTGLNNLTDLNGGIVIASNSVLEDISPLDNLNEVGISTIRLSDCPNIQMCDAEFICRFLRNGGQLTTFGNGPGCTTGILTNRCALTCKSTGLRLSTQQDVVDFVNEFPRCQEIGGNPNVNYALDIEGTVTDLTPLSNLRILNDGLQVINADNLTSLHGLHNIESITGDDNVGLPANEAGLVTILGNDQLTDLGDFSNLNASNVIFRISQNPLLSTLDAFNNVQNIYDLRVDNNPNIANINGLSALETVGASLSLFSLPLVTTITPLASLDYVNGITLSSLTNLPDLGGLEGIQQLRNLNISNCPQLINLNELSGISGFTGFLTLENNNNLENLNGLESITGPIFKLEISQNASLQNMDGLSNLQGIDGLSSGISVFIGDNPALININLGGGTSIPGDVIITRNFALESISSGTSSDGFTPSITSIDGDLIISNGNYQQGVLGLSSLETVGGELVLDKMSNIGNLSFLSNLTTASHIEIYRNSDLTSLAGLPTALGSQISFLRIIDNSNLNDCVTALICTVLENGADALMRRNGNFPCDNETDVLSACGLLPVTLLDFSATPTEKTIYLSWQTAAESQNRGFHVQHSTDGRTWRTLDFVAGAGDSNASLTYDYLHQDPAPGINYYRLEQEDFDGTSTHTFVVEAKLSTIGGFTVYPNPARESIMIGGAESTENRANLQISVHDLNGRELMRRTSPIEFSITDLPPGVYFLRIQQGDHLESLRFTKI